MSIIVDVNRVSHVVAQHANLNGKSSKTTQDENIYEKLKKSAEDGDIERLYELIAEDPNILCHFDKVLFCETPLHTAAEKGQTHFAMELMILKPSLASKLNVSGFSPMHLALQNNHSRIVRGLVAINKKLVNIKGRGGITPLHHVVQTGDTELLSELLFACPSSIEDLTIKFETAVHIAVKNQQLMAFKVLLGWIKRVNKQEILGWKDEDGNTVFHIAAFINQTEVMTMHPIDALFFFGLNGFAFLSSLYVIVVLIIGLPMWKLIYVSVAGLSIAMFASYYTIFTIPSDKVEEKAGYLIILALPLMIGTMLLANFMAFIVDRRRRHRVDFPASCFSISDSHPVYALLFSGISVGLVLLYLRRLF